MSAISNNNVLIREIKLNNVLSFGPQSPALPLNALNVLIGPNGSGKSNLIDAISILRATPGDLYAAFGRGGGFDEWVWKGNLEGKAVFEFLTKYPSGKALHHTLEFEAFQNTFRFADERIEDEATADPHTRAHFYYSFLGESGDPLISVSKGVGQIKLDAIARDKSILVQRRDPDAFPEISYLADVYARIGIHREWSFGRDSEVRKPQKTSMFPNTRMADDCGNLAMFLDRLCERPSVKADILRALGDIYDGITDICFSEVDKRKQVFIREGDFSIPATRLSDGTLRYLCLLAILLDPEPPPLICIEEPELGLHPDLIPKLADHLIAASTRTQLIVTTHSDILIGALSDTPESVVVCEKHDGQTEMRRLKADELTEWLAKYRLGELWLRGQLGGTRW